MASSPSRECGAHRSPGLRACVRAAPGAGRALPGCAGPQRLLPTSPWPSAGPRAPMARSARRRDDGDSAAAAAPLQDAELTLAGVNMLN
ncbi:Tetratricopeptide repeat protein 39C [Plecturocebus cupreus]